MKSVSYIDKLYLVKAASKKLEGADVIPVDTPGGIASDYLGLVYGPERAARAKILMEAAGGDPPYILKNPLKSLSADGLLGLSVGGAAGALGGYLGTKFRQRNDTIFANRKFTPQASALLTGIGGAAFGGLFGLLNNIRKRRRAMRGAIALYDQEGVKQTPTPEDYTSEQMLLSPLSGPYRKGERDALRALESGRPPNRSTRHATANMVTEILSRGPAVIGLPALVGRGYLGHATL